MAASLVSPMVPPPCAGFRRRAHGYGVSNNSTSLGFGFGSLSTTIPMTSKKHHRSRRRRRPRPRVGKLCCRGTPTASSSLVFRNLDADDFRHPLDKQVSSFLIS
uniref:Uncharacterized protein LOC101315256 n=1 Tax=Rhizophora mucronata TaxID=61149 RepID=A0A2P2K0X0_RHIMU